MKRINDDSRACSDAKAIKTPAPTDLAWMLDGPLDDCKIAAGRAPLQDMMKALQVIRRRPAGGGRRKDAICTAMRHRFGVAPYYAAIKGGAA